jgi:hypothetical protein
MDVMHLTKLCQDGQLIEAKAYIMKYFLKCGIHIMYFDGKTFILYKRTEVTELIPNDACCYDKKTLKFDAKDFIKSSEFMKINYQININFSKPKIYESQGIHYINMAKPFGIDITKQSDKSLVLSNELKLIYDHILNIWCSKNKELNEWILNFIACTLGGRKVRKAIYSQCDERCGRGTIVKLLMNILGDASVKTSSVETVTQYTKPFEGCLLLNFDEMPVDNNNFKSIGDKTKGLVTEDTFDCRAMHNQAYQQKNTFNIIITTNNDALHFSQTNKERYMVTDIDESMKGNVKYFTAIHNAIDNKNVQLVFYHEMIERFKTLDKWNEDVMPLSNTKQIKLIDSLPRIYKYIKDEYILTKRNLIVETKLFYRQYFEKTKDNTSKKKLIVLHDSANKKKSPKKRVKKSCKTINFSNCFT